MLEKGKLGSETGSARARIGGLQLQGHPSNWPCLLRSRDRLTSQFSYQHKIFRVDLGLYFSARALILNLSSEGARLQLPMLDDVMDPQPTLTTEEALGIETCGAYWSSTRTQNGVRVLLQLSYSQ